jgi:tetratricopeptide (TPR) repeat protein
MHPSTLREAAEAYRLLAERYDDLAAHSNLASVVLPQLERYEEALEHAQAVRRLGSADAFAAQAMVVGYALLNRFPEAHEAALEILRKRPDLGEAHRYVGITQAMLGRTDEAIASLRRAHELAPESDDSVNDLWMELVIAGRLGEARAALRPLLDSTDASKKANGHALLAHLAGYEGRSRESAERFAKAAEMTRGSRSALASNDEARVFLLTLVRYGLAAALLDAGRDAEAVPYFEFVTKADAGRIWYPMLYVRSFYFLARIAEKKGEKEAARKNYERFLFYWKDGDTDRDRVAEAQRKARSL